MKAKNTETTTLGTRFDERQRELIEKAAALRGCSTAKLIREFAIQGAAGVLNASGDSEFRLRELASCLLDHIRGAKVTKVGDPDSNQYGICSRLYETTIGPEGEACSTVNWDKLNEIKAAFEKCSAQFIQLLLDEWNREGKINKTFEPQFNANELLGRGGVDEED